MLIVPNNWAELQHYKDRSPPWIKLHKKLLDNYDFQCLPVASRALAPMLWLLASEHDEGEIDADPKKLAFRLRMNESEAADALQPLVDKGFFSECKQRASKVQAKSPKPKKVAGQVAMPETEKRREEAEGSAEPIGSAPASGFAIPLNDGTDWPVPAASIEEWRAAFPAADVEQELREMRAWSQANPSNRKTSRGVAAFIVRWLQKAQDTPGRSKPRDERPVLAGAL